MSDVQRWRERVDDVLWVELGLIARRNGPAAVSSTLGPRMQMPPTGLDAVDAFEAIGLLDAEAAGAWRARLVGPRPPRESTHDLRERMHGYLSGLVRSAIASRKDGGDAWIRPQTVLNDLHFLGLIDQDERHWWFSLLVAGDDQPAVERDDAHRLLERLVRSIPGPAERRRGLRLLSVDLFEDGVCVHLHLARRGRDADDVLRALPDELEPGRPLASRALHVRLEDDLGTTYRGHSGGGGGGGSGHADGPLVREQTQTFATPVPAAATRLVIATPEIAFEVAL